MTKLPEQIKYGETDYEANVLYVDDMSWKIVNVV